MKKQIDADDFSAQLNEMLKDVNASAEECSVGGSSLCEKCSFFVPARCLKLSDRYVYRRAFSESKLLEILDFNLEPGHSYHVISGGDIDSLSFIKHILRNQDLDYLLFSTWCMATEDIVQLKEWIDAGKIKRIDAYVGEIFTASYAKEHAMLKQLLAPMGGRVCIFRNHSKVYAGTGTKYKFAVESSANINTNPRTENTTITIDEGAYKFYKEFYDKIKSFQRDFDEWKPYEEKQT